MMDIMPYLHEKSYVREQAKTLTMNFRITIVPIMCILFATMTNPVQAQEGAHRLPVNRFAVGISTGHYGYDPAAGIDITTSSFFRDRFSLRLHGTWHGLEAYQSSYHHWASYQSYSLGIVYHSNVIDHARFFLELGMFAIIPDSRFSKEKYLQGLYQFSGVEVFFINTSQYYIGFHLGIGPTLIDAHADKLERSPRYGNGIFYLSGLRLYF